MQCLSHWQVCTAAENYSHPIPCLMHSQVSTNMISIPAPFSTFRHHYSLHRRQSLPHFQEFLASDGLCNGGTIIAAVVIYSLWSPWLPAYIVYSTFIVRGLLFSWWHTLYWLQFRDYLIPSTELWRAQNISLSKYLLRKNTRHSSRNCFYL